MRTAACGWVAIASLCFFQRHLARWVFTFRIAEGDLMNRGFSNAGLHAPSFFFNQNGSSSFRTVFSLGSRSVSTTDFRLVMLQISSIDTVQISRNFSQFFLFFCDIRVFLYKKSNHGVYSMMCRCGIRIGPRYDDALINVISLRVTTL